MKRKIILPFVLCISFLLCSCADTNDTPTALNTETTAQTTLATSQTSQTQAATTAAYPSLPSLDAGASQKAELNFNKTQVVTPSGKTTSAIGWKSTDYMSLGSCYGIEYELPANAAYMSVAFFNAELAYVGGIGTSSNTSVATTVRGFAVCPEDAEYVRFLRFYGNASMSAMDTYSVTVYADKAAYDAARGAHKYADLTIACIGDSLTEGDYGGKPGVANRKFANYPYFLSKTLGCTTINYGKCGYAATHVLNIVNNGSVDVSDADVILLMIGTNKGLEAEQESAYRSIISALRAKMKDGATLVLLTPPQTTVQGNIAYVDSAVKKARAVAEELGLPLIDVFAHSPIQKDTTEKYQPADGLHLNEEGYKALAEFIAAELEVILEK